MKKIRKKMDLNTAMWLVDKAENDRSVFPVTFEECEHCGADYIAKLGHDCNNTIELDWKQKEDAD